ncbi:PAS domain S-box-containing protein [Halopiger aswanensis]|uniref:histidine kinase n=1 Tax=Halopiger aswanensis TaxID=148449 RepID=A0A419W028_9EURY|nr:PAS domain S-box-containing protein [Halopiger aswanensis]
MAWFEQFFSFHRGRKLLVALGGLYIVLGIGYPFLPDIDTPLGIDLIITLLVVGSGVLLFFVGYRLPQTDIHPETFPVITKWCVGGISSMLGLIGLIAMVAGLRDPIQNILILTAIGSTAGLAAGTYDARAKTRTRTLEQRNRELNRTQAELEETVTQLEESEQRYRTLTENFPNGAVALLNTELRHTLVAGQGFDSLNFSASDLQGERIQDVYPEEILKEIEPNYRAALDGEPTTFELAVQGRIFEFRTHPLTTDEGEIYAILAMSQDITEHKQHERKLTKRARQQQAIADLGQLALETADLDELMSDAARQVTNVLGIDYCKILDLREEREELLLRQGIGWHKGLVGEATVSAVEANSQAAYTLEHAQPVVVEDLETDTRFSGPDLLTDHDVRSGISTIIGPFDEPWGILATHDTSPQTFSDEDISFIQSVANVIAEAIERRQYQTELERLIADLEELNKRLEQFAYATSHDLQEPLRMVSSYLQLIERRYEDDLDEEGLEFLEFAVNGADRMRAMIDGLLKYSRVETEADPLEPVDLESVLEDVCQDLQPIIETTDATITAESLPRVEGDPHQLRQVFQNLLRNAIQYSGPDSPTVSVSAQRDSTDWIVTVQDEGIGIDPEDQDRISTSSSEYTVVTRAPVPESVSHFVNGFSNGTAVRSGSTPNSTMDPRFRFDSLRLAKQTSQLLTAEAVILLMDSHPPIRTYQILLKTRYSERYFSRTSTSTGQLETS